MYSNNCILNVFYGYTVTFLYCNIVRRLDLREMRLYKNPIIIIINNNNTSDVMEKRKKADYCKECTCKQASLEMQI